MVWILSFVSFRVCNVLLRVHPQRRPSETLERLVVSASRAGNDIGRQFRSGRFPVPADVKKPVADELLIETRLIVTGLVGRRVPEPRAVGCDELVDHDQLAVDQAEFKLAIGNDDSAPLRYV